MKKEYTSPKSRVIVIESGYILSGSLLNEEEDTQDIEINTEEVLDTQSPTWVVW